MKYRIIKYGKEERENLLKKHNLRKKCYLLTNLKVNGFFFIVIYFNNDYYHYFYFS